jgi:hypothetical protein
MLQTPQGKPRQTLSERFYPSRRGMRDHFQEKGEEKAQLHLNKWLKDERSFHKQIKQTPKMRT